MKTKNRAQIDLNKKLILERSIFNDVRLIFNEIAAKSSGPFFNPLSYSAAIRKTLRTHYARVHKVFGDDYREIHNIKISDIQNAMLVSTIEDQFVMRAEKQARIIGKTNIKQLEHCKKLARENTKDTDLTYGQMVVNLYSAMLLRRVNLIAIYETQWSAEYSKAFEVSFLLGGGLEAKAVPKTGLKRWDAVGDDIMRDWHADADSTVIDVNEPFQVDDEELMFPGDTSLGATAKNIANCRCSVSYELDRAQLTKLDQSEEEKPKPKQEEAGLTLYDISILDERANAVVEDINRLSEEDRIENYADVRMAIHRIRTRLQVLKEYINAGEFVPYSVRDEIIGLIEDARSMIVFKDPVTAVTPMRVDTVPQNFSVSHREAIARADEEIREHLGILTDPRNSRAPADIRDKLKELNAIDGKISDSVVTNITNNIRQTANSRSNVERIEAATRSAKGVLSSLVDDGVMSSKLYNSKFDDMILNVADNVERAFAHPITNTIHMGLNSEARATFAHEFGHHIEFNNPHVMRRLQEWRNERIERALASGDKWKPAPWGGSERLLDDGFYNAYISKVYDSGFTEVLSMGVEALYDPFRFAEMMKKDPEHFRIVWATLRGY